jgi:hypothetical protein
LDWRPIEGDKGHVTNSLAVLAAHIAGAEHFWIAEVVVGHIQLTYQLWKGGQSKPSPFWFERLPSDK